MIYAVDYWLGISAMQLRDTDDTKGNSTGSGHCKCRRVFTSRLMLVSTDAMSSRPSSC